MNKIIESTHPNIDNYFKNLLSIQEESYKKEKNRIKEYFSPIKKYTIKILLSFLYILFAQTVINLINISEFTIINNYITKLILLISLFYYVIVFFFNIFLLTIYLFSLSFNLDCILFDKQIFLKDNKRKMFAKMKEDFNFEMSDDLLEKNIFGFYSGLKKENKYICKYLESHLSKWKLFRHLNNFFNTLTAVLSCFFKRSIYLSKTYFYCFSINYMTI